MLFRHIITALAVAFMALGLQAQPPKDWANHRRYAAKNDTVSTRPAAVLMGNSITDFWVRYRPQFFADNRLVGRGISGQVSGQMLCRMQADVVALHPRVVVIMAGINDLCLNQGPTQPEYVVENLRSMAEIAVANGIIPIICSVTPAHKATWRPELVDLAGQVRHLNELIVKMCHDRGYRYLNYYDALATPAEAQTPDAPAGSMNPAYTNDALHPNPAGYTVTEPLLLQALKQATD